MTPETIAALCIPAFLVLISIGLPVAYSLPFASFLGMFLIRGWETTVVTTASIFTTFMADYNMAVIPAFVLMGTLAEKSGILDDLFNAIEKWVGQLPGGLALGAIGCNTIFAACSGSVISACTVIGKASIPKMLKAGYPPSRAMGVVAVSGTLASLIPPSIIICLYGLIVSQSIGKLLIAGIVPGLFSACCYAGVVLITCRKIPRLTEVYTWKEKLFAVRHIWVAVVIVLALIGVMYFGLATPAEAGSVGASCVFILCLLLGKMSWAKLIDSISECIRVSGMVLFLVVSACLFGRLLVMSGLNDLIVNFFLNLNVSKYVVFLFVAILWILLGMIIDAAGMMVVSIPFVYPIMTGLGFDPIWLGIICVKFCDIALVSPPVGIAVYTTQAVSGGYPLTEAFKGVFPFMAVDLLAVVIWLIFPGIILFLPNLM